ncbi:uncharacterized protein LOC123520230 isoform X2 [Portunus trituberculatus]|uniref:uncharacterized protein LOC123520230 isoform X2 n=1 Tax=Portunus trituberculatus TaxID=210409 RepID=UPI001E1CFC56|nr:uncharacterized protein LOC123520230 isoform X2 [Portunus trituberculatus]
MAPDLRHPPASAGELTVNFSREERLILYEHTLKNAASVPTPPELLPMDVSGSSETQPKELSGLELKKAMRDFKRRRQAYRTKISTKNKSQNEVTREIIDNMMALLGLQDPKLDLPGTSGRLHAQQCNEDCDNDLYTLGKSSGFMTSVCQDAIDSHQVKNIDYTKHQEQKTKRSKQKSHSRSRNPKERIKYQQYDTSSHDTSRFLDERKHRRMGKKYEMKSERHDTPDRYQSRSKDRGWNQGKEKKRKKDESEYRTYEQRKISKKEEKYENEERHYRQEAFSSRSKKRERNESKKRSGDNKM